ncbi:MAG TPA: hypothetical protein VMI31_04430 [Fimbriimonadaceae bacterium]|nr:hypothetical protein [Fimbriimonadaceae bacterium]
MKRTLLIGVVLAILCLGCSQQSREEYGAAGKNVTEAAKETGKGIAADAKQAGAAASKAAKDVGHDIRESTDKSKGKG